MAIVIRPAVPSDLAAVDAVLARSYPKLLKADYAPSVLVMALPLISRANPALLRSGTYFVADEEGAILGAGGWTRDRRERRLGHVRHVVTDDRHLRRGVARAIMARIFETARADGIEAMEAWATFTAVPFYASLGFRDIGPMQVPLAPGIEFPARRMITELV